MPKFVRVAGLLLSVLLFSLTLTACGTEAETKIQPYSTAKPFDVDAKTQQTFKDAVKGVKDAKLDAYTVSGTADEIKNYYQSEFQKNGWANRENDIKDAAQQQTANSGWALAYEKGSRLVTLTFTPGNIAATNFPNLSAQDNLLIEISASK